MSTDLEFILGDKLPLISEAVIAVTSYAPGGSLQESKEPKKRKAAINAYSNALHKMWSQAFGEENICNRKYITKKLREAINVYTRQILVKYRNHLASRRARLKQWRTPNPEDETEKSPNKVFNILAASADPNNFDKEERVFYYNQISKDRIGYLSEKINEEHENKKARKRSREEEDEVELQSELSYIEEASDVEENPDEEFTLATTCQKKKDYIPTYGKRQCIRNQRNFYDNVKTACSRVSANCGISAQKSIIAVRDSMWHMTGHKYYLSDKEQAIGEGDQSTTDKNQPSKSTDGQKGVAHTAEDWRKYEWVMPSEFTVTRHKLVEAAQQETEAALALANKPDDVLSCLHYDTTQRNKLDGDWPALILKFSNGEKYTLRGIYLAYEDRENIVRLLKETYTRLAKAAQMAGVNVSAKDLYEKTDAIMTDAVSKNLKIEDGLSEAMNSEHKPNHLLCQSHTVEGLDRSNLQLLEEIEKRLKLRPKIEALSPRMKSFLHGKNIVTCAITAFTKLVTHDKSGSSVSLAEEWDLLVEREGASSYLKFYPERRFTKLGYSAAAIIQAYPLLQKLLNETYKSNLLVEACRLYMECDFIMTELKILATFTHKVTLPLLNMVELSDHSKLQQVYPVLWDDLKHGNMDTLNEYSVVYKHVPVSEDHTPAEKEILKDMCGRAADVIDMQRGREYRFDDYNKSHETRATDISTLTQHEKENLPTNNLEPERKFSVLSRLAEVAKYRNRFFKAKGIRTDMTLHQAKEFEVTSISRKVSAMLMEREDDWTQSQKNLLKERVEQKMKQAQLKASSTTKLLEICKGWRGPCTTITQLQTALSKHPDRVEKIVTTELKFHRDTHKLNVIENPDLYRLLAVKHDERLENLCILLSDNPNVSTSSSPSAVDLPTEADVLAAITNKPASTPSSTNTNRELDISINDMFAVIWNVKDTLTWFVGYIKSLPAQSSMPAQSSDTLEVEHLERITSEDDVYWKYPSVEDRQFVELNQLLPCTIVGSWDIAARNPTFHLQNSIEIDNTFKKYM